jgi:hypothetical protein
MARLSFSEGAALLDPTDHDEPEVKPVAPQLSDTELVHERLRSFKCSRDLSLRVQARPGYTLIFLTVVDKKRDVLDAQLTLRETVAELMKFLKAGRFHSSEEVVENYKADYAARLLVTRTARDHQRYRSMRQERYHVQPVA